MGDQGAYIEIDCPELPQSLARPRPINMITKDNPKQAYTLN